MQRNWQLHPSTNEFTFPSPHTADGDVAATTAASRDQSSGGVVRGVPMRTLVGPALRLAQQLEAII